MRPRLFPAALLCLALAGCGQTYTGPSPARAALAAHGQVDPAAPLQFSQQITINASPERVWSLLTDLYSWPRWQPAITQITVDSFHPGTPFSWRTQDETIRSTVELMTPLHQFAFTGDVLNFHAIYVFTLTALPGGGTQVAMQESVGGFLIRLFYAQSTLDQTGQIWLQDLKLYAEAPS
jgi:uncharacterized protein YndB with AHSA1/START domain